MVLMKKLSRSLFLILFLPFFSILYHLYYCCCFFCLSYFPFPSLSEFLFPLLPFLFLLFPPPLSPKPFFFSLLPLLFPPSLSLPPLCPYPLPPYLLLSRIFIILPPHLSIASSHRLPSSTVRATPDLVNTMGSSFDV